MRRFAGTTTTVVMSMIALAAAGSVARGQEELETAEERERRAELEACSIERARAAVYCFLTQGPGAPRPDVTWAQVQAGKTWVESGHVVLGGAVRHLIVDAHQLEVSTNGSVITFTDWRQSRSIPYLRPDKSPRTDEEREQEVAERTHFDEDFCRARALAFLRNRYPDYDRRSFYDTGSGRRELSWLFRWQEERTPDVLAIYPNYLSVSVSAETGEVQDYMVTNIRKEVRTPPPVTEAMARELAAKADGRVVRWAELVSTDLNGRAPRPLWIVIFESDERPRPRVYVDPQDGTVEYSEDE